MGHLKQWKSTHIMYMKKSGCYWKLSDIGSEFKNMLFAQVAKVPSIKQDYSSPYSPRVNDHMEGFHNLLQKVYEETC